MHSRLREIPRSPDKKVFGYNNLSENFNEKSLTFLLTSRNDLSISPLIRK